MMMMIRTAGVTFTCRCMGYPTDIHQSSQNLRHLYPGMRINLEVFGLFLVIKITAVRQVLTSLQRLWSEREDKTGLKHRMVREDVIALALCLFSHVWSLSKNTEDPQIEPYGQWLTT